MAYEINHTCYRQVFILPKEIVEKHLKLSGTLQLKVLLWMFYHQGVLENLDQISADLGAHPSDVQDALQYWIVHGIIIDQDRSQPEAKVEQTQPKPSVIDQNEQIKMRSQKPTRFEVARRLNESSELSYLVCEAQNKFGRSLTDHELSVLTYLMDSYGLSPAVILMVIEYARSIDKCNIRYIESTAVSWANEEIDTVEKAEVHLTKIESLRLDWNTVCRTFGIDKRKPSKQEQIYINRWLHEWDFSVAMLKEAYDQCVNNVGKVSFSYMNKVLENWHNAGYNKPSDIQSAPKNTAGSKLKKASGNKTTSYNLDDLNELL